MAVPVIDGQKEVICIHSQIKPFHSMESGLSKSNTWSMLWYLMCVKWKHMSGIDYVQLVIIFVWNTVVISFVYKLKVLVETKGLYKMTYMLAFALLWICPWLFRAMDFFLFIPPKKTVYKFSWYNVFQIKDFVVWLTTIIFLLLYELISDCPCPLEWALAIKLLSLSPKTWLWIPIMLVSRRLPSNFFYRVHLNHSGISSISYA